jgi:hypothetical protein
LGTIGASEAEWTAAADAADAASEVASDGDRAAAHAARAAAEVNAGAPWAAADVVANCACAAAYHAGAIDPDTGYTACTAAYIKMAKRLLEILAEA